MRNKLLIIVLFSFFSSISGQSEMPQPDDWQWEKYEGNPVLRAGNKFGAGWDAGATYMPNVIKIDGTYHMWYTGLNLTGSESRIGYATSPDGKNWSKYSQKPVLVPGGTGGWPAEQNIGSPSVYFDGETFHMWYFGFTYSDNAGDIGYASSTDGKSWTKYENNPVIHRGTTAAWDDHHVGVPSVLCENDQHRIWYWGHNAPAGGGIGTALSSDGLSWNKSDEPIMANVEGELLIWGGRVIKSPEGHYLMWYTSGLWGSSPLSLRYAVSGDGMEWSQFPGHSVIAKGANGTWDDLHRGFASVIFDEEDNKYKMWYFGSGDNNNYHIGYAEAANPLTDIEETATLPENFLLSQNYPNPFNPATTIKYSIPAFSKQYTVDSRQHRESRIQNTVNVSLLVYDVLGKEVATLVNKQQRPGSYEVKWDASGKPSGVYFYKLNAGTFTEGKKMILLR